MAGADGLKTGHTDDGGYGLVGTVKRGDRRLLLVVNGLGTMRARGEEGERLLEWGFREFDNVTLFRAAETVEEAPVYLGDRPTVPLVGNSKSSSSASMSVIAETMSAMFAAWSSTASIASATVPSNR